MAGNWQDLLVDRIGGDKNGNSANLSMPVDNSESTQSRGWQSILSSRLTSGGSTGNNLETRDNLISQILPPRNQGDNFWEDRGNGGENKKETPTRIDATPDSQQPMASEPPIEKIDLTGPQQSLNPEANGQSAPNNMIAEKGNIGAEESIDPAAIPDVTIQDTVENDPLAEPKASKGPKINETLFKEVADKLAPKPRPATINFAHSGQLAERRRNKGIAKLNPVLTLDPKTTIIVDNPKTLPETIVDIPAEGQEAKSEHPEGERRLIKRIVFNANGDEETSEVHHGGAGNFQDIAHSIVSRIKSGGDKDEEAAREAMSSVTKPEGGHIVWNTPPTETSAPNQAQGYTEVSDTFDAIGEADAAANDQDLNVPEIDGLIPPTANEPRKPVTAEMVVDNVEEAGDIAVQPPLVIDKRSDDSGGLTSDDALAQLKSVTESHREIVDEGQGAINVSNAPMVAPAPTSGPKVPEARPTDNFTIDNIEAAPLDMDDNSQPSPKHPELSNNIGTIAVETPAVEAINNIRQDSLSINQAEVPEAAPSLSLVGGDVPERGIVQPHLPATSVAEMPLQPQAPAKEELSGASEAAEMPSTPPKAPWWNPFARLIHKNGREAMHAQGIGQGDSSGVHQMEQMMMASSPAAENGKSEAEEKKPPHTDLPLAA